MKIPTAKHALGNGKWEAGLLVPIGFSIAELTAQHRADAGNRLGRGRRRARPSRGDGAGREPRLAGERQASLSAELWGQWDWDPAGTAQQASADGSVAYLLSDDVQIDAGANFGLNRQTPDVELYARRVEALLSAQCAGLQTSRRPALERTPLEDSTATSRFISFAQASRSSLSI